MPRSSNVNFFKITKLAELTEKRIAEKLRAGETLEDA